MSALHNRLKKNEFFKPEAFIDGVWIDTGKTFPVFNPATGEKLADMAYCGRNQTEVAIEAAHKAFQSWRKTTATERATILNRWYALIMENRPFLGELMTAEQGKPLPGSAGRSRLRRQFHPVVRRRSTARQRGNHSTRQAGFTHFCDP